MTTSHNAPRTGNDAHTPTPWTAEGMTVYALPERRSFGGPTREYLRPVCDATDNEYMSGSEYAEKPDYRAARGPNDYNVRAPSEGEALANAAFIVRACNSHAALVAALESLMDNVDMQRGAGERHLTLRFDGPCLTRARAALAAARNT